MSLLALCGLVFPFGNILGPLVIWLVKKDEYPFVDQQGKESLNFQITVTIFLAIATVAFGIIGVLTCGIGLFLVAPVLGLVSLAATILVILAALAANNGQSYVYPFSIRFIA